MAVAKLLPSNNLRNETITDDGVILDNVQDNPKTEAPTGTAAPVQGVGVWVESHQRENSAHLRDIWARLRRWWSG